MIGKALHLADLRLRVTPILSEGGMIMAARKIKKDNLPRGIMWREDRQSYLGRFTYQGQQYALYDTEWKRLEERMNTMRKELKEGAYIKECTLSLNAWFDQWMETYKKKTLKYSTYQSYLGHFNYYVRNGIGKKKLKDVTVDDIQKLYNSLCDRDFADGTIKLLGAVLSGCFKKAVINRMISWNPVALAEIPRCKEKKEKYVFSKAEQAQFLECIRDSYLHDFFRVVIMSGMRNGEARALQWKDVDFEKKLIHVNHTLITLAGGGYMLDTPKTKTSKRIIPLLPQAEEILIEMKKCADNMGIGNGENFVFCLPDGVEISRERVTTQLKHIEKKMADKGIPVGHITCHTLRHAFATRAIESGMKPQVLKTILGHSNISMTMDLYAHVLGDEKVQEMILLEKLF